MAEVKIRSNKTKGVNDPVTICKDYPFEVKPVGHVMTLSELEEKQVLACDILNMYQYPMGNIRPTLKDSDYDSCRRIVFFIPGRESKYVKVSE